MSETGEIVTSYLSAIADRDFDLARNFLADRGFSYTSPIGVYEDADRFIKNISLVGPILERLDIRKCLVTGNEAITILDTAISLDGYSPHTVAMLFVVAGGTIKSIEAIFDASDYYKMFSGDG